MSVQKGRSSSMATIVRSFLFHYFHHTIAHLYVDRCIYADESVARVKFAYSQGHQISSYTWAHKNLSTLTSKQVNSEMARTEQTIQRLIGVQVAFTRPPYGEYNNIVRQVAANRNQKLRRIGIRSWSTGASIREIRLGLHLRRAMLRMISS